MVEAKKMFPLFKGLNATRFYAAIRKALESGLPFEKAIWEAIQQARIPEAGCHYEVQQRKDGLDVWITRDKGGESITIRIPTGYIPRAWIWWIPPSLRTPFIISSREEDGIPTCFVPPPISSGDVCCDFCNAQISFCPVPAFLGTYALCEECFRRIIGLTLEEAAQMDGVTVLWVKEENESNMAGA